MLPLPPIEPYHISEPSTPSYSPLPLDNTPVDGRDIMDPSQLTTIPNIPAPPLFDENLNSLANGTLSTIPEGTELSEDRYNETLNTTFGYSNNIHSSTAINTRATNQGPPIESGDTQPRNLLGIVLTTPPPMFFFRDLLTRPMIRLCSFPHHQSL